MQYLTQHNHTLEFSDIVDPEDYKVEMQGDDVDLDEAESMSLEFGEDDEDPRYDQNEIIADRLLRDECGDDDKMVLGRNDVRIGRAYTNQRKQELKDLRNQEADQSLAVGDMICTVATPGKCLFFYCFTKM